LEEGKSWLKGGTATKSVKEERNYLLDISNGGEKHYTFFQGEGTSSGKKGEKDAFVGRRLVCWGGGVSYKGVGEENRSLRMGADPQPNEGKAEVRARSMAWGRRLSASARGRTQGIIRKESLI